MAENKTKPTDASVEDYIASRVNEEQRADCKALMSIFKKITKQQPKMWGPSMVGYGSCRYTYESGRTGGCSSRALRYAGESSLSILSPKGESKKRYCPSWENTGWASLACTSSGWQSWTRRFLSNWLRTP
jgi:hypothetical protein